MLRAFFVVGAAPWTRRIPFMTSRTSAAVVGGSWLASP